MSDTSLKVTLPAELARMVEEKVASGAYESESEVIREGLRALQAQEVAIEQWLRTEGVARFEAYRRDPRGAQPAAEVFARLRAHHAKTVGR